MSDKFRVQFNKMQQVDLTKMIRTFYQDQEKWFQRTSIRLYQRFKDFPEKSLFDADNKMQLSYFCLKFLSSIFFRYAKNILLMIDKSNKYYMITDQFGFIIGFTRKQFQPIVKKYQTNKSSQESNSPQVQQLLVQVFGKQYIQVDQKNKLLMSIEHGGTPPVQCTMGLDVSTAVVGISIFQNVNKKPIFLDAILLTKLCDKQKLDNNLVNKLKLFKNYFESVIDQKNIKITKLYIQEQCKRFGASTNAITLNKLRKFNGMVSGYLMQKLDKLQQVGYINVRSRRKMVIGKRMSKQQAYEFFKDMYKQLNETQYKQVSNKDANMDRSDAFIINCAGLGIRHSAYNITKKTKKSKVA